MQTDNLPYILIIGIILFLTGAYFLRNTYLMKRNGKKTRAKIIGHHKEVNKNQGEFKNEISEIFYPILEFTTNRGEKIEYVYHVGANTPMTEKEISIYYLQKNKKEYRVLMDDELAISFLPIVVMIAEIICILFEIIWPEK